MTFPLSLLRPAGALALLLAGCSPATDETTATKDPAQAPRVAAGQPFRGTIRLVECHYLLGIRQNDYVTLTFDGPRLRREVRSKSFTNSSERYGVIADLRTDSVTFYLRDDKRNAYHRLAKTDYLARVAANAPILPEVDQRPFGTVFGGLPPDQPALSSAAVAGDALRRLSRLQALLFLMHDGTRCDVFYSEQVRVPKMALAYIEHNAPTALPTLALSVQYTPLAKRKSDGLLDRLQHGLELISSHNSEFESLSPTVSADAFDLPIGSTPNLKVAVEPETGSSHHHHHHH